MTYTTSCINFDLTVFFSGNYLCDVMTLGSSSFPWDAPVHRIYFGISWLSNEDVLLKFPNGPKKVREFLPKNDQPIQIQEKKHHPEQWKELFYPPQSWNLSLDESAAGIPQKIFVGGRLDFSQNLKVVNQPNPKNNELPPWQAW